MAKNGKPNINRLSNGNWQIDWGRSIPKVKDPRSSKAGKWVSRRSQFRKEHEAKQFVAEVLQESREFNKVLTLDQTQRMDWLEARRVLDDAGLKGMSVGDVTKEWLVTFSDKKKSCRLVDAFEKWEKEELKKVQDENLSKKNVGDLNTAKATLLPFFGESLHTVAEKGHDIMDHVSSHWSNTQTKKNHLNKAGKFFYWCISHGLVEKNPFPALLKKLPRISREVEAYTIDEAKSIMDAAYKTNSEYGLLAYYAIALFAGCRPSEIKGLNWNMIILGDEEPHLTVSAAKTKKNKSPRLVDLRENAVAWLSLCDRSEPIVPTGFSKRRRKLLSEAGVYDMDASKAKKMKQADKPRHTFGTFYYGLTKDVGDTTYQMGNSEKVFQAHYRAAGIPKSKAEKYFSISPMPSKNKVVPMVG